MIKKLIIISILLNICGSAFAADVKYEFQKGMCYVTWTKDKFGTDASDASLKAVAKTGAKWVAIIPTWYQEKCSTNNIFAEPNKTATDESVVHAIKTAHSLGMKVMIKPHLDVLDTSDGSWRGDITCATDPDWNIWFDSYSAFIVHYAELAQANNAEIFCIGTELMSVSATREAMWREKVIAPVRKAYKGPITYAANWDDEYLHINFWDALDYVGIDAYYPLSDKSVPTLEELKAGWAEWVRELEKFQAEIKKPIIFPEIGYCSADGAAKTPWEEMGSVVNMNLQADCYQAAFETFWNKPWFYGIYWWKWGTDTRFGGMHNKSFTPQNKPAAKVVEKWYKKSVSRPSRLKK